MEDTKKTKEPKRLAEMQEEIITIQSKTIVALEDNVRLDLRVLNSSVHTQKRLGFSSTALSAAS